MRRALLVFITLLLAAAFSQTNVFAAQGDPTDSEVVPSEDADVKNDGADNEVDEEADVVDEKSPPVKPSIDVFIPTEEISEDFAVSFPVDI